MAVPKGYTIDTAPSLPKGYTLDAPQDQTQDFTTNTIDPRTGTGYGLYRMSNSQTPGAWDTSKEIQVPHNRVKDAQAAGYKLHPDEEKRWQQNSTHEGEGPGLWEQFKADWQANTQTVPDVPVRPFDPKHPIMSTLNRAGDTMQNVYQMPWNIITTTDKDIVGMVSQLGPQVAETVKQIYQGDPKGMDTLSSFTPPEMAASLFKGYQSDLKQYGSKAALANLMGHLVTLGVAGKIGGKLGGTAREAIANPAEALENVKAKAASIRGAPEYIRGGIRDTLGVSENTERTVDKFGKESQAVRDKNVKDKAQHELDTREAEHATQGREIGRQYDVHQAAKEGVAKHRQEVADVEANNARVNAKALENFNNEAAKVRVDNQRVMDKYAEAKNKITEENAAAEHMLDLRRAEEQQLQSETDIYYAVEDAEKLKAKDTENAAWKPWHDKMDDLPVDGGAIQKKLEPILSISPEATRAIRQLTPDPYDADNLSDYGKERQRVMESNGYPKGTDYFELPADKRLDIDKMVASSGITPDPIDFDPKAGVSIPVKVLHRVQSILGRNIAAGRYEGVLLGEMKKVQSVLRQELTDVSVANGTDKLLDAARAATREYQEAFGRERPTPKTLDQIREKGANPDEYKEREDERRLAGAAKLSPNLEEAYKQVKARREALKKLPTEDQLRKSIQQVSPPPTTGDLRPGYQLKPNPVYEPPTVGDLRPGYNLKPTPALPPARSALEAVKEPERVPAPAPFQPTPPPEVPDIQAENLKYIDKGLRKYGKVGSWVLRIVVGGATTRLWHGNLSEFGGELLIGQMGVTVLTHALRSESVLKWLAKPSAEDLKMISTLPPEDAARLRTAIGALAGEERRINPQAPPPSPIMAAWLAGAASTQMQGTPPTLPEVKQKAQELQNAPTQPPVPPPPPPPGPEAAIPLDNLRKIIAEAEKLRPGAVAKPAWSHTYDESTGRIVAV